LASVTDAYEGDPGLRGQDRSEVVRAGNMQIFRNCDQYVLQRS